ncbi:porin [uncultured Zhongshania sp.]|uniref:OprO/OprP family phosphate-selective porin n=1 Tax=uncultured Zhongshania sp. TaxID=1642288 RepID=UPI0030DB6CBD|tara:strand:+ start:1233 stop:2675 length:1443 start_codon:yes stop_codon:yes gene_type:complete
MTKSIANSLGELKNTQKHSRAQILAMFCLFATSVSTNAAPSSQLNLYVDRETKQVFTEPGTNRVKLGTFEPASEELTQSDNNQAPTKLEVGNKGLVVTSGNGDFAISLGGRIHADSTTHLNDELQKRSNGDPVEAVSGTELRRARLALKGRFNRDFTYTIEGDWGGNSVSMKDVLMTYHANPKLEITVGNQKHAVSMEVQESSNDIMFNERSLLTALTLPHFDRAMGVNVKTMGQNWSFQSGVYGDAISASGDGADEGGGFGARGTFAPINEAGKLLHIGANVGLRKANDNNNLSNSKTPRLRYETTNMSDFYLSDTGSIAGFEEIQLSGLELAAMRGRFSAQAEWGQANIKRDSGSDLRFDAHYLQLGWTLTGEARNYKGSDGEFKMLKPRNNFDLSQNHWGAWELALRLDELNLKDEEIEGGSQQRISLNLNWYLNANLRILFGYSRAYDVDAGPLIQPNGGEADNVDVISLRTQMAL